MDSSRMPFWLKAQLDHLSSVFPTLPSLDFKLDRMWALGECLYLVLYLKSGGGSVLFVVNVLIVLGVNSRGNF